MKPTFHLELSRRNLSALDLRHRAGYTKALAASRSFLERGALAIALKRLEIEREELPSKVK